MTTPEMEIADGRGGFDASKREALQKDLDRQRFAGVTVCHPVTGEHMPDAQFRSEVDKRNQLQNEPNASIFEYWTRPLEPVAAGALAVHAQTGEVVPEQERLRAA